MCVIVNIYLGHYKDAKEDKTKIDVFPSLLLYCITLAH